MLNLLVLVNADRADVAIKLAPEVFTTKRKLTINGQKFEDSAHKNRLYGTST